MNRRSAVVRLASASLLALLSAATAYGQAQIATDGPVQAVMRARTPGGEAGTMPLVNEELRVTIDAQLATTQLEQVYRNQTRAVVEGRYRLRAGAGSRVEGFAYWNGEQKIAGEVFEKQTARAIYDSVTRRRRDPGLLEEEGDGVFSFQIFPIQPDENKRVQVRYTRWLVRRGKTVEYRAPVNRPDADIVVTLGGLRGIANVRSPSHEIDVDALRSGGVRVRSRRALGNAREFVLRYQIEERPWTVSTFVHRDPGQDGYFALALAAPDLPGSAVAAKDVTLVLDRSGSMAGEPIAQARAAAANVIRRLDPDDRVNVVVFDDDVDPLFEAPRPLTADIRERAIRFVEGVTDGGGTDLALALRTALASQEDGSRPRVILFLTDGQSDVEPAIAAARADARDVRVFTVGLGDGVNRPLLSRLAAVKRGRFMFIRDAAAIERDVGTLYRQISQPLLVDVALDVSGATAVRTYPRTLNDLFVADQLVITGRLRGTGPVRFTVRGTLDGKPFTRSAELMVSDRMRRPWVGKLWAQSRVDHLLEEIALSGENEELSGEAIELALAYNFVTQYTSFLAIPESELSGAAADRMRSARERKSRILAKHSDAADLESEKADAVRVAGNAVRRGAAPRATAPAPHSAPSRHFAEASDADDDSDSSVDGGDHYETDEEVELGQPIQVRGKGGCAGCAAAGAPGGSHAALWLLLAAILLGARRGARRRRATPPR